MAGAHERAPSQEPIGRLGRKIMLFEQRSQIFIFGYPIPTSRPSPIPDTLVLR
jgi:hypothetical protein